ncbi:MAG TPA: hypothetical protein VKA38_08970, partial [Draconibacterium sp.]|nr:hypothetical protein [Draconibacterium sp.]
MKRICFFLVFIFVTGLGGKAQSYLKTDLGIKTAVDSIGIEIQFFSPSIVRILKWPEGEAFTKSSLSVIKTPEKTDFGVNRRGDNLFLKSKNLAVVLNLKNGKVSFETLSDKPLLNETVGGVSFTDFNDAGIKTYSVAQSFILEKDEAIYGLGQQQRGRMIQRNLKLRMIQGNTDDYVTFFQSVKGYGLFWDNYSPTVFEDTPDSTSFKSDVGDCVDYYFM